ncbi:hypothetical protein HRbin06_00140 [archaeon HR06]|nr:hypothetical protein HRbin06_00140 [archaeon HR06]
MAGTEKTGPQSLDSCIVNSHDGTVNLSCITETRTTTTGIGTTTLTQTTTSTTTVPTSTIVTTSTTTIITTTTTSVTTIPTTTTQIITTSSPRTITTSTVGTTTSTYTTTSTSTSTTCYRVRGEFNCAEITYTYYLTSTSTITTTSTYTTVTTTTFTTTTTLTTTTTSTITGTGTSTSTVITTTTIPTTSTITQTFTTTSLSSGTMTLTTTITSTYTSTTNTILGSGGKVIFWDTNSPNPKWIFRTAGTVNKVDISADGERIAAISTDKGIYLFNKDGLIWNFITGKKNIDMDLSDDGKALGVINDDGKLFFFKDNNLLWIREDNLERVSLSFKGDLVLYGGRNKLFFSKGSGEKIWESNLEGDIRELKLSKDGAFAVVATSSKLFFFNTERRSPQWSYSENISDLEALDISDDGNYIAVIYRKNLALWSSSTNLFGNPSPDWSLELSSNLNTVKVNSIYEAVVVLKNVNDFPIILTSRSSLQFSSDERIFSGYLNRVQLEDGSIFRLDPKTNSGIISVGKKVILYFDPPKEFKSLPPSGNYRVHVSLDGYYINGVPFKQELNLGSINL